MERTTFRSIFISDAPDKSDNINNQLEIFQPNTNNSNKSAWTTYTTSTLLDKKDQRPTLTHHSTTHLQTETMTNKSETARKHVRFFLILLWFMCVLANCFTFYWPPHSIFFDTELYGHWQWHRGTRCSIRLEYVISLYAYLYKRRNNRNRISSERNTAGLDWQYNILDRR